MINLNLREDKCALTPQISPGPAGACFRPLNKEAVLCRHPGEQEQALRCLNEEDRASPLLKMETGARLWEGRVETEDVNILWVDNATFLTGDGAAMTSCWTTSSTQARSAGSYHAIPRVSRALIEISRSPEASSQRSKSINGDMNHKGSLGVRDWMLAPWGRSLSNTFTR